MEMLNVYYMDGRKTTVEYDSAVFKDAAKSKCCVKDNNDGTYSLWRLAKEDMDVFEDAMFEKDETGKINMQTNVSDVYFESRGITNYKDISREKINRNDVMTTKEFLAKINPYPLRVSGFNIARKPETENIYLFMKELRIYNMACAGIGNTPVEEIPLTPIEEKIGMDFANNTKYTNIILTAAIIERIGKNETVLRVVSSYRGKMMEHSRIWTRGTKSIFSIFKNGKWVECNKRIKFQGLDFAIRDIDELEGTYIGKIIERTKVDSVKICLSLLTPAFENLIEMKADKLFKYITSCTTNSYDITEIREGRSYLGHVNWEAPSFAEFIDYPSYSINIIEKNMRSCVILWKNSQTREFLKEYIKKGNKERSKKLIELFNDRPTTLNAKEYGELLTFFHENRIDLLKGAEYINGFKESSISSIITYIDYIDMYDEAGEQFVKDYGFKWNPAYRNIGIEHDRICELMEDNRYDRKISDKKMQKKFSEAVKKADKYSFADDKLSIIVPSSMEDVVLEGKKLCHCVATYLDNIADEKTTILFIRKNSSLDEPYFTLEIKDKKVRQCHGKYNSNMTDEISDFVKRFCEEKGVKFTNADEVLCAEY